MSNRVMTFEADAIYKVCKTQNGLVRVVKQQNVMDECKNNQIPKLGS